jgi:hypothetical protein
MQLRPASVPSPSLENRINFGLSASNVSCIVSFWGFIWITNCHQPSLAVLKDPPSNLTKSSQDAGHHTANSNPINSQRTGGQSSESESFEVRISTNGPNLQWSNFTRMSLAGCKSCVNVNHWSWWECGSEDTWPSEEKAGGCTGSHWTGEVSCFRKDG